MLINKLKCKNNINLCYNVVKNTRDVFNYSVNKKYIIARMAINTIGIKQLSRIIKLLMKLNYDRYRSVV